MFGSLRVLVSMEHCPVCGTHAASPWGGWGLAWPPHLPHHLIPTPRPEPSSPGPGRHCVLGWSLQEKFQSQIKSLARSSSASRVHKYCPFPLFISEGIYDLLGSLL